METNIKTYKEQVLELGNRKMLAPGCYDKNMNYLCDVKCLMEKRNFPEGVHDYSIHHVIMPESTTVIECCLFASFEELESVVLPDRLEEIGSSSFYGCSKLKQIQIPNNVRYIGNRAFMKSGLVSLFLPASIESFGSSICEDCTDLVTFCMPEAKLSKYSMERICPTEAMFSGDEKLTIAVLPEGITDVGKNAFRGCISLKKLSLPSTVKEINDFAFFKCDSLDSIEIPHKIDFISPKAFGPESDWSKNMNTIIKVDGYQMTVLDIAEKSVVSRILDVMKEIDNANRPRLTDAEIEIVMRALVGEPILTSSDFANKVERILRQ